MPNGIDVRGVDRHCLVDQPSVIITDKLRSYVKPVRDETPDADHRAHKGLNNRIESALRPT